MLLGGLSSSDTANDLWYQELNKSSLNPPGYVFGIVWPILYIFMSISAFRTFEETRNLFLLQLFFNAIWSWLFFAFHMPVIALFNIWFLIALNLKLIVNMFKTRHFFLIVHCADFAYCTMVKKHPNWSKFMSLYYLKKLPSYKISA